LKIISLLAEIVFIAFVFELIWGFILEGPYKGALLMGLIFGFPCSQDQAAISAQVVGYDHFPFFPGFPVECTTKYQPVQ